ncbi:MAG: NAD-dependent epimerase/dehydratase family protein [Alphaproteobacteria bacterium]|nr:NAD-dependent epimerase/dehydratase family protein [Alphaproteobacteria bacterium]
MTILVTGATGFVGSAVLRRVAAAGLRPRALVRRGADRRNLAGVDCDIVEGDLARPETLVAAVAGCEAVFHVAADYRIWVPDPATMDRINIGGTAALVAAATEAGVKRIVYTSSVATLKLSPDGLAVDEDSVAAIGDMTGLYKRSKFLAEAEVLRLVAERRAPAVIVQPSAPIGPRDIRPTPTGRTIVMAARGKMPAYVETGLNVVHVDDVAEGHWLAYQKGEVGRRYILGGDNLMLRDILAIIAAQTGRRGPLVRLPADLLLPAAWVAERAAQLLGGREPMLTVDGLRMSKKIMFFSSARAERELGYTHRAAELAIADAIAWFRSNGYLA